MNAFAALALKMATQESNNERTTNGGLAYKTTRNANLDLFGKSGEIGYPSFLEDFKLAFKEDSQLALRNLLHTRDIRGGKGVRNTFQKGLYWLSINHPDTILKSDLLEKTVEVGYWKDLYQLVEKHDVGIEIKKRVINLIARGLDDPDCNSLAAKWLPLKGPVASMLRSYLRLTPKELRQKVVALRTEVTERLICENRWGDVVYQHVPSRCMHLLNKAFRRHDEDRFTSFIEDVSSGVTTMNSGTLYPHQVSAPYAHYTRCDRQMSRTPIVINDVAEAQWKSLPNYLEGKTKGILPVVDLSGSMDAPVDRTANPPSYAHLAITLGAYISERTQGPFKDLVLTFADKPAFVDLTKTTTLASRLVEINKGRVGYSTNIEGVFNLLLSMITGQDLSQDQLPESLIFLSDTQSNFTSSDRHIYKLCQDKFKAIGYTAPKLIFWVLNAAKNNNVPVEFDSSGAALVSGFSSSTLKGILTDLEQYTPENVMLSVLSDSRYTLKYWG